ncbi:MAG: HEAT repeat domain-containing protein [Planctomycetota bacterium]
MLKLKKNLILLIALVAVSSGPLFGQTIPPAGSEDKLIAVIKSDASHKEKADACRHLAIIGTKKSIAPLAALLGDEKLSHMARYALEPIPDTAVDIAFRDALSKLKGQPLVGLIGSIGVRGRCQGVFMKLIDMLDDPDPDVAQAAARALGKIPRRSHSAIAKGLTDALETAPAANRLAICEGLFRCAEAFAANEHSDMAVAIYDRLMKLDSPHQVRGGALRGAILTRGKDGVPLLREYLQSKDYIMFSAAVQAAQEMKGGEVTTALTDGLKDLSADNQILIIQTLGKRGDASALPALSALAKSGDKSVRIAAIKAVPDIGDASAVPVFVGLVGDSDREISKAVQEALSALPGEEVDAAVMAMFNSIDVDKQRMALYLIGRRRMTTSVPALLKAAGEADPRIQRDVLRKVGEMGSSKELPSLLALFMDSDEPRVISASGQALVAIYMKADNPQSYSDKLIELFAKAKPPQKKVLLNMLGTIGGPKALEIVLGAVDDIEAGVYKDAIRALSSWRSADVAPHLLVLAKKLTNQNEKTLCLRGYLGLASRMSLPADQRLSMCRQVEGVIGRDEEKKLLLGALSNIDSTEALAMIMPYLDEPATRKEASMGALAIAERLLKGRGASKSASKLIKPLEKVIKVTSGARTAQRAKGLLKQAQSKAK